MQYMNQVIGTVINNEGVEVDVTLANFKDVMHGIDLKPEGFGERVSVQQPIRSMFSVHHSNGPTTIESNIEEPATLFWNDKEIGKVTSLEYSIGNSNHDKFLDLGDQATGTIISIDGTEYLKSIYGWGKLTPSQKILAEEIEVSIEYSNGWKDKHNNNIEKIVDTYGTTMFYTINGLLCNEKQTGEIIAERVNSICDGNVKEELLSNVSAVQHPTQEESLNYENRDLSRVVSRPTRVQPASTQVVNIGENNGMSPEEVQDMLNHDMGNRTIAPATNTQEASMINGWLEKHIDEEPDTNEVNDIEARRRTTLSYPYPSRNTRGQRADCIYVDDSTMPDIDEELKNDIIGAIRDVSVPFIGVKSDNNSLRQAFESVLSEKSDEEKVRDYLQYLKEHPEE